MTPLPDAANGPPTSPGHSTAAAAADEQQQHTAERSAQRRPPGTKRLLVVASVLAYVLFLGVPVWWHTTSLHRPALPHDAMQAATADGESAFLPVHLQVVVVVTQEQQLSAAQLHGSLTAAIASQQPGLPLQLSAVVVARAGAGQCSRHPPAASAACPDLSGAPLLSAGTGAVADHQQLDKWLAASLLAGTTPGHNSLLLLPGEQQGLEVDSSTSSSSSIRVGRHRHAWATYSAASTAQQLQDAAVSAATAVLSCCFGLHAGAAGLAAARPLPVSAGGRTHLSLSLLNAVPGGPGGQGAYTWDMQRWEERVLAPLAASLAPATALTSESQVLHYTPARITGEWSEQHRAYVVPHAQLPYFIDSEWSLEAGRTVSAHSGGSSAAGGQAPNCSSSSSSSSTAAATAAALLIEPHVLQLVAYVPPASQRPLLLLGSDGQPLDSNSFVIPSWGGLLVLNPEPQQEEQQQAGPQQQLTQQHYDHITAVVAAQLQALLGVVPAGRAAGAGAAADVQQLPAGAEGFSSWQVDALMRQRAAYAEREAARVLAALSTLVQELPNLEMPDLIGQQVAQALADVALARAHTAAGAYAAAAAAASTAHAAAEAAFAHPAVLTQLNFPDSHKLGVYMPLFLPLAVPLLQGLVLQLKHRFKRD